MSRPDPPTDPEASVRAGHETEDNHWWVIEDGELMGALYRVSKGESPWVVYMELYANSEHEDVDGDAA